MKMYVEKNGKTKWLDLATGEVTKLVKSSVFERLLDLDGGEYNEV